MEVIIEHLGAVQFEIKVRGHAIVSDQPRENGGFDEGMTPPELLLASLGSCAAFYAAQYLRKHKLATEGTRVRVTAEKECRLRWMTHIARELRMRCTLALSTIRCSTHQRFISNSSAGRTLLSEKLRPHPRILAKCGPPGSDSAPPYMSGCYLVIDLSPA